MSLCGTFCLTDPSTLRSRQITKWLEKEARRSQMEFKILLLGTGEAGKSTFLRQMRILHGEGFSEAHRLDHKK
jgi:guanine nucleotide-binding protein G(q) subunit alpha